MMSLVQSPRRLANFGAAFLGPLLAVGGALALSACEGIEVSEAPRCVAVQVDCTDNPVPPARTADAGSQQWEITGSSRVRWNDASAASCPAGGVPMWEMHGRKVVRWCSTDQKS